jgi:hypothetical protein
MQLLLWLSFQLESLRGKLCLDGIEGKTTGCCRGDTDVGEDEEGATGCATQRSQKNEERRTKNRNSGCWYRKKLLMGHVDPRTKKLRQGRVPLGFGIPAETETTPRTLKIACSLYQHPTTPYHTLDSQMLLIIGYRESTCPRRAICSLSRLSSC